MDPNVSWNQSTIDRMYRSDVIAPISTPRKSEWKILSKQENEKTDKSHVHCACSMWRIPNRALTQMSFIDINIDLKNVYVLMVFSFHLIQSSIADTHASSHSQQTLTMEHL